MVTAIVQRVSKNSLDFQNQRIAYMLRTVHHKPYTEIAAQVVSLKGKHPAWGTVRNIVKEFSMKKGCRPYHYSKCGRKPWKFTKDVQQFVLRRLLADRMREVVTSKSVVELVAKEKGIIVAASSVRALLAKKVRSGCLVPKSASIARR